MSKQSRTKLAARLWMAGILALQLVLPLGLSGCLSMEMHDKIAEREPEVEAGVNAAKQPAAPIDYNPLVVTDKVWTGGRSVRMRHGLPLPSVYEGPRSVVLVTGKPMQLADIATFLTQQTGVPVRLTDGAETARGGTAAAAPGGANGAAPNQLAGILGQTGGTTPAGDKDTKSEENSGMRVAYQGNMSGFLDNVSSYFGVSWKYDGTSIVMSRYETRTFSIEAMNATGTYSDGISGGGSSGGSSGGSGGASGGSSGGSSVGSLDQQNKLEGKVDYWNELDASIQAILGGVGSIKTAPSSGTVTVITTPDIMRTVATYIEQENQRGTRQVAITVELFTLSLTNSEDINTDVNLVYKGLTNGGGFNGQLTPLASGDAGNTFGVSVISPTSKWYGSRALIQALSSLGKVSRVARIPMTTLNNRPTTRRIGRDIAYLAQRSTTTTSGSDSQSETLTPGTVQEGFQLQVTPRILGDGRIIVQFSLSVTDLIDLAQFPATGTPEIQLPETADRIFVQQALLNNGDSLVLAGFDQDQQTADNSGFLNPFNLLLGGKASAEDTHEMIFLTITPREIDVPNRQMISGTQN